MAGPPQSPTRLPSARPGRADPAHQELARRAGEYTTVARFSVKPGGAPVASKDTAKLTSVTKQYEATWTYSLSSAFMKMAGTSKDGGKTIDWAASCADAKGEKQALYVSTRRIDDDRFVVELFGKTPDGKKGPTFETTCSRKK